MTSPARTAGGRSRGPRPPLGPSRPPHLRRLVARVLALDGPLVQIWAWPGSGQQAVLDALTTDARFGQPLSLDDLTDSGALARAVDAAFASGARWLVLPAMPSLAAIPEGALAAIARRLAAGTRLVFSSPSRQLAVPLACSYLLPQELLLGDEEIASLWREVAGTTPAPELVERLARFTDGWYRPLRLAAELAAEAGGSIDPEALVEVAAVASFLRHEVLALLTAAERELLVELSAGRSLDPELWQGVLDADGEALRRRLVEERGLALEAEGSLRLPYLLRWFLARERRARWPRDRQRELATRLSAAELALDRPVSALEQLAEAGESAALADLLDRQWPRLLAEAPLGLVARLEERRGGVPEGSGTAFLTRVARAILGRGGAGPPAEPSQPAVAAAAALVAELLGGATPDPARGRAAELPPEVRPLHALALARRRATEAVATGEEDEETDLAVAVRLVTAVAEIEPGERPRRGPAGLHGLSALQAIAERTIVDLLWRRQGLEDALAADGDLPPAWRLWLEQREPTAPAPETSGYLVELLGPPAVRLRDPDGDSVDIHFPLRRALEVLAYLATSPRFEASRGELAEALWPEAGEDVVGRNFHPTISHLRRSLRAAGDASSPVVRRGDVYRLNPRLVWNVDAVELVRGVEEGHRRLAEGRPELAAEAWSAAWRLYGGPLLQGWDAAWVVERRDELQRRYLEMLRSLGEVRERLGRFGEAVDALRAALAADPLQEPAHQALMRLYARLGRRDHVRRQYERLAGLLAEELEGAEPLDETTALYRRLMS